MAQRDDLCRSHLVNPLVTSLQLRQSASARDGLDSDVELAVRFASSRLLQSAGVLLRLPQDIVARAIILCQRTTLGWDGLSFLRHNPRDIASACLYVAAKTSDHPKGATVLLTAIHSASVFHSCTPTTVESTPRLPPGDYQRRKLRLYDTEAEVLRVLGYDTQVALPYALCINYLQTLGVFSTDKGQHLARTAIRHLNTALISPQVLFLTHQPNAIATAAIYLAARQVDIRLPECDWWEVFDTDREELGFLVVALLSTAAYASRATYSEGLLTSDKLTSYHHVPE